jgi:beta-phosphoglucomutase
MPSHKALIFDMDGTLVDNMSYHKQSWIALFKLHNLELDYETFDRKYHKGSLVEIMSRLFPQISDREELFRMGNHKEELYREMYRPHVQALEGLHDFLKIQAQNLPMGIATMGDQHNIDFIFNALALHSFFHSTTGGHQVVHGKPHPEIFLTAAQKLNVAPEACLAFEDSHSGVLAAKAAGMEVIGVSTMLDEKTLLELGCVQVIENFSSFRLI